VSPAFHISRLSNSAKGLEEKHLERTWAVIKEARKMLADTPCPDTFLGRKTQEPFPKENGRKAKAAYLK
jgi:hypothetical protein